MNYRERRQEEVLSLLEDNMKSDNKYPFTQEKGIQMDRKYSPLGTVVVLRPWFNDDLFKKMGNTLFP
jgi:hypothetical protein